MHFKLLASLILYIFMSGLARLVILGKIKQ